MGPINWASDLCLVMDYLALFLFNFQFVGKGQVICTISFKKYAVLKFSFLKQTYEMSILTFSPFQFPSLIVLVNTPHSLQTKNIDIISKKRLWNTKSPPKLSQLSRPYLVYIAKKMMNTPSLEYTCVIKYLF